MEAWLALPGDDRPERPAAPVQPETPVTIGDPVWCSRCARMIEGALRRLDDDAAVVAANVDGYRGAAIAGPNGQRARDHKAIVETLDDLFGTLVETEDQWRAARGYPPRTQRGRGAHARMVSAAWLCGQIGDILLHPGSVTFGLAVLKWQRTLRAMGKTEPANARSPICCPRCSDRQVRRKDDGYYECESCGRLLTQREHDDEYARQADEHDHEQQEAHA
ncbi:hypothetical protein [Nonomuraea guangzhouensis]|uniref:Transposase n=1 Tax=Nonomuraea guangzhouensis TaxID=1291555 RepID=A0ABW4GXD4_9ACTN|nr:hypothetical protein [Nonomuraea guangzhouensis]